MKIVYEDWEVFIKQQSVFPARARRKVPNPAQSRSTTGVVGFSAFFHLYFTSDEAKRPSSLALAAASSGAGNNKSKHVVPADGPTFRQSVAPRLSVWLSSRPRREVGADSTAGGNSAAPAFSAAALSFSWVKWSCWCFPALHCRDGEVRCFAGRRVSDPSQDRAIPYLGLSSSPSLALFENCRALTRNAHACAVLCSTPLNGFLKN